jgi:hypothetical protein
MEMKPAWGGVAYFKIYDEDLHEVHTELIDTIQQFKQLYYDSIIKLTFLKGLSLTKKLPDFVPAGPLNISFCNYNLSCAKATFVFDTIGNKVYLTRAGKGKNEIKVLFDSASIASNIVNYFGSFDDAHPLSKAYMGSLFINSIREFQIGKRNLLIVHIGSGHKLGSAAEDDEASETGYETIVEFTSLETTVFEEAVLHHGHGFDFLIWE